MTVWHAAGMPEIRRTLQKSAADGMVRDMLHGAKHWHRGHVRGPVVDGRRVTNRRYAEMIASWARAADLYFVSSPMSAVIEQAAKSVPSYRFLKEDMPSSVGLVVWADPIGAHGHFEDEDGMTALPIRAALWAPAGTLWGPGVQIVLFTDGESLIDEGLHRNWLRRGITDKEIAAARRDLGPLAYFDEAALPYGQVEDAPVDAAGFAGVMSTWLLMGQRIAVTEHERLPRQMVRQAIRRGEVEPRVRTITLRRAANPDKPDPDGQAPRREYHHQWIVRGFWRNQWYPSENRHKPIFIADYVKGPAGAPMLGGERVSVLRR